MITSIKQHELTAEWEHGESEVAVKLMQTGGGYYEQQTIVLHPWQLYAVCEQLVPTGDPNAHKTIARMARRLDVLHTKISEFRRYVTEFSDHDHADLSKEMTKLDALALLSDEWAADAADCCTTAEQAPKLAAGEEGVFGRSGAPPTKPCIELEAAVAKAAGALACEQHRRPSQAREAVTGLVGRGVLGCQNGWLCLAG